MGITGCNFSSGIHIPLPTTHDGCGKRWRGRGKGRGRKTQIDHSPGHHHMSDPQEEEIFIFNSCVPCPGNCSDKCLAPSGYSFTDGMKDRVVYCVDRVCHNTTTRAAALQDSWWATISETVPRWRLSLDDRCG